MFTCPDTKVDTGCRQQLGALCAFGCAFVAPGFSYPLRLLTLNSNHRRAGCGQQRKQGGSYGDLQN